MAQARSTTDHDVIRRWVEERGGHPARVAGAGGPLRIEFPGFGHDENLERLSWEAWWNLFEEKGLAFLYEERTAGGQVSRFNALVSRSTAEARPSAS